MKKILVVDNHPLILRLLENRFHKLGHEVRTAGDGLQALDVMEEFVPDIIFLDLVMPNIDGEQLCRIIRQDPRLAGIYIVIISAIAAERECDLRLLGADACIAKGAFAKLEAHFDAAMAQLELPPGERQPLGVLGLDQVYQRESTRELISARHHFEVIINNMVEGVVELTRRQRVIYLNPAAAALLGRSEAESLGRELPLLLPEPAATAAKRILAAMDKACGRGQRVGPFPLHGRQVVIDFYSVPADSRDDEPTSIARFQDITEQHLAENNLRRLTANLQQALADLQQAQAIMLRQEKLASIGTLASGVAHEILNPLNIIASIVQLLEMEEGLADRRQQLAEVMNQIRRATRITDNLRMFSHRHETVHISKVDVNALFDKTALLVEHDLNLDNIRLERDFAPDLPPVLADEDQLAQVFLNLLNNARAALHARPERRITIRTRPAEDGVAITFADTGQGIAKEHLAKLFDPFFTTKAPGEGTGLGLAVVYSIIESHNGSIEVFSEPGQGAEFFIHLPHGAANTSMRGTGA